jgi:hypothetical protein
MSNITMPNVEVTPPKTCGNLRCATRRVKIFKKKHLKYNRGIGRNFQIRCFFSEKVVAFGNRK